MTRDADGTRFAPSLTPAVPDAVSGHGCAAGQAFPSASEVPLVAGPSTFCLRFLPGPSRARFRVQIIDLATGDVLDETPHQALAELPEVLTRMVRWVSGR